jgi:DNA-binding NarL/FixJ family response regulator
MIEATLIKVMVVDDHPLMRAGISSVVSSKSNMVVVAEAANGIEAIENYKAHKPDVTLMDLRMEKIGGIDAIKAIRQLNPNARIIVLTSAAGDIQARRALQAGASAYLLKNLVRSELVETIQLVHAGHCHIPTEIASRMAEHSNDDSITPRELDVLKGVARGLSNKLIADDLGITEHTVKNNLKRILSKLDARDRTHAVMIALDRGFIER